MFSLISLFVFNIPALTVPDKLKQIPEKDREELKLLFTRFIRSGDFAYTIFGDKAISFASIEQPSLLKMTLKGIPKCKLYTQWNKWNIWKKYEKLFPIKKFLFIEECSPFNTDINHIYLICKPTFVKNVNQNIALFQNILGKGVTGESLLNKIKFSGKLRSTILNNELLLGILLGYGRHNSTLYNERERIIKLCNQYKNVLLYSSKKLKMLKNKEDSMTEILQTWGDVNPFFQLVSTPQFVADIDHPETIALQNKYYRMKRDINNIYQNRDLLDITLTALIKD